jgi:hypothetical protein
MPTYRESYSSFDGVMNAFPQLVNDTVMDRLTPACAARVECVSQAGMPQQLWAASEPVLGTSVKGGMLYNYYYPSPEMQRDAAALLEPACRGLRRL